jgi:hypothetical protein
MRRQSAAGEHAIRVCVHPLWWNINHKSIDMLGGSARVSERADMGRVLGRKGVVGG